MRLRTAAQSVLAALLLAAPAACGRSAVDPLEALPARLALRSDLPLVRGAIVETETTDRGFRVLVRGAPASPPRVDVAWVTVGDALLVWPDGRDAARGDLRVGRRVIVWVTGPVLESYPVQATASAILLER
jgi:hypothetical protein